jgi:hypothetical protein
MKTDQDEQSGTDLAEEKALAMSPAHSVCWRKPATNSFSTRGILLPMILLLIQIVNRRIGVILTQGLPAAAAADQAADLALRIVQVTENPGAGRAGLHAGGLRESCVDAVRAEPAFLDDAVRCSGYLAFSYRVICLP